MYSRGLGVVVSNTDMVMGPNFSTQPITLPTLTQPIPPALTASLRTHAVTMQSIVKQFSQV